MPSAARRMRTRRRLRLPPVEAPTSKILTPGSPTRPPHFEESPQTIQTGGRASLNSRACAGMSQRGASTTRTGERSSRPGSRQVNSGSSASMVFLPTRIASALALSRCACARAVSPVAQTGLPAPAGTRPFPSTASLIWTKGRRSVTRSACPRLSQSASFAKSPRRTCTPWASSQASPRPATRMSGSSDP